MGRIVVVHGVGRQLDTAETLLAEVEPAVRGGVGLAVRQDPGLATAPFELVCASYGGLFRRPGTRGEPYYQAEDVELGFEAELLMEWWREAARSDPAVVSPDAAGRGAVGNLAARALTLDHVRRALHALSHSRFFAAVSDHLLIADLKQVRRYFNEPELREAARSRVSEVITPDTKVVVAHSLGSVVAYEALCALREAGPLALVTLGSPLGLGTLVFNRLQPAPDGGLGLWPGPVKAWHNVADDRDVVALVCDLSTRFGPGVQDVRVDNDAHVHRMTAYLTAVETGMAVAQGLAL
ncbi:MULTISPECIES: hypothetical protein [unclassified Streptomyces]|uniref:hypothetical protein n=1 Tax=unclassified Streptomyces TaxID=2593676 RepID=UPI002E18A92B